jgi:HK97 family phage prohead protease
VQHLAVKAAFSEVTDLGEFTAIAAAYTVDRVKDRIVPGAFEKTIAQWRASGKRIPVHWDHCGDAANVIGSIDPAPSAKLDQGLYVEGKLDLQASEVAREAWRSMKNDAVSLSFGYVALKSRRRGVINDLPELDLFEVSIVPHPANPDTRVLRMKAAVAERSVPSEAALRAQAAALGSEPPLSRRLASPQRRHSAPGRAGLPAAAKVRARPRRRVCPVGARATPTQPRARARGRARLGVASNAAATQDQGRVRLRRPKATVRGRCSPCSRSATNRQRANEG